MDAQHAPKRTPPRKRSGQQTGPRKIDGLAVDVRGGGVLIGQTERAVYGMVARGLIPYRRRGGRIIFLRAELEAWLQALPGVTLEEAMRNQAARREQ